MAVAAVPRPVFAAGAAVRLAMPAMAEPECRWRDVMMTVERRRVDGPVRVMAAVDAVAVMSPMAVVVDGPASGEEQDAERSEQDAQSHAAPRLWRGRCDGHGSSQPSFG
jgi:hypothetical protein